MVLFFNSESWNNVTVKGILILLRLFFIVYNDLSKNFLFLKIGIVFGIVFWGYIHILSNNNIKD